MAGAELRPRGVLICQLACLQSGSDHRDGPCSFVRLRRANPLLAMTPLARSRRPYTVRTYPLSTSTSNSAALPKSPRDARQRDAKKLVYEEARISRSRGATEVAPWRYTRNGGRSEDLQGASPRGDRGSSLWPRGACDQGIDRPRHLPGDDRSGPRHLTKAQRDAVTSAADDGIHGSRALAFRWDRCGDACPRATSIRAARTPTTARSRASSRTSAEPSSSPPTTATHGLELWRSDGTAAGTKLVRDINPGDCRLGIRTTSRTSTAPSSSLPTTAPTAPPCGARTAPGGGQSASVPSRRTTRPTTPRPASAGRSSSGPRRHPRHRVVALQRHPEGHEARPRHRSGRRRLARPRPDRASAGSSSSCPRRHPRPGALAIGRHLEGDEARPRHQAGQRRSRSRRAPGTHQRRRDALLRRQRRHPRPRAVALGRHRGGDEAVRDIAPGKLDARGSPGSRTSTPRTSAGHLYFSANDGIHGAEPWRSDGTRNGTAAPPRHPRSRGRWLLPRGFRGRPPGRSSSAPTTARYGFEPWVWTAPRRGRRLVRDIYPGTGCAVSAPRPRWIHERRRDDLFRALRHRPRHRAMEGGAVKLPKTVRGVFDFRPASRPSPLPLGVSFAKASRGGRE